VVNPNLQAISGRELHDMKTTHYTKKQILNALPSNQIRSLEPGYAGDIDNDEAEWIRMHLKRNLTLAKWWGFSKVPRATNAIKRIAMDGDPDDCIHNRSLVMMKGA
jgi:hypothetical protein